MSGRLLAKWRAKVGGLGEEGISKSRERKPETIEPVCFHGYSREVWAEFLHMHSACGFLDLTVGPGYAAEACIAARIPYVGFVQTECHETVTRRYLFKRMWEFMQKPGHVHYEPELSTLLSPGAAPKPGGRAPGSPTGHGGTPTTPKPTPSEPGGGGAPQPGGGGAPQAKKRAANPSKPSSSGGGGPALKKLKSTANLLATIKKLQTASVAGDPDEVDSNDSRSDPEG